ncbi:MAG: hypothetical protein AMJ45_02440 [Syntrophobacter sp. DG_60]|nr:MAG: hypothetical protein AMJ45_02440 [Syntrophobacter sp. DG_60]
MFLKYCAKGVYSKFSYLGDWEHELPKNRGLKIFPSLFGVSKGRSPFVESSFSELSQKLLTFL